MALYQIVGTFSTSHNITIVDPVIEIVTDMVMDNKLQYRYHFYKDQSSRATHDSFEIGIVSHAGEINTASYSISVSDSGKSISTLFDDIILETVSNLLLSKSIIGTSSVITPI